MKLLIFLGMMTTGAFAQSPLAKFSTLVGTWEVITEMQTKDGTWKPSEATTATIEAKFDGKVIQEEVRLNFGQMHFDMLITYTYDHHQKVYRVAAIDHRSGLMDIFEGQMEAGTLVVSNLKSKTFTPWGEGRFAAFRLKKQFKNENTYFVSAEVSFDEGETWKEHSRTTYRRKG